MVDGASHSETVVPVIENTNYYVKFNEMKTTFTPRNKISIALTSKYSNSISKIVFTSACTPTPIKVESYHSPDKINFCRYDNLIPVGVSISARTLLVSACPLAALSRQVSNKLA